MPNDLPATTRIPGPDDDAHNDGLLMHELTVLNTLVGRYVLRHLDADAGYDDPIPTADEHALADRLISAGDAVRARAVRRTQDERRA